MQNYKLKDIVTIVIGPTLCNTYQFTNEGMPIVTTANWTSLKNGYCLPRIVQGKIALKSVPKGTILVHPLHNTYYVCQEELYVADGIIAIIPCQAIILSPYLVYYLQAQALPIENLKEHDICLPSLTIQQQYVTHLAQLQAVVEQMQTFFNTLSQMEQYMPTEKIQLVDLQQRQKELILQFQWIGEFYTRLLNNILKMGKEVSKE